MLSMHVMHGQLIDKLWKHLMATVATELWYRKQMQTIPWAGRKKNAVLHEADDKRQLILGIRYRQ